MLPDYPALKKDLAKILDEFMRRRVRVHLGGGLNEIPQTRLHEGDRNSIVRPDKEREETKMMRAEAGFEVTAEEIPSLTLTDLLKRYDEVAKKIAQQQAASMFSTMSEATARVGNVVDGRGQKFSVELLFQALEKIEVDFDENGSPEIPSMVISPQMEPAVKAAHEELNESPELRRRWEQLMIKKKESWRAREASRRLVG